MTKYIKLDWPEYQEYMEHPKFREDSYYIADCNSYMIPEYIIEDIDRGLIPPETTFENTSIGTVTLYNTLAVVNAKDVYDYREPTKGEEVLIYLYHDEDFRITTCKVSSKGFPILFEDNTLLEGLNCKLIGTKDNNILL